MVDRELTDTEAETTVKAIKDGLNAVLESSTEFCAPFIGSLHVSTMALCVKGLMHVQYTLTIYICFLNRICVFMKSNLN